MAFPRIRKILFNGFCCSKIKTRTRLKSPTVIVLVDRTDLDTQISGIFDAADVSNVESTDSISELQTLLGKRYA